MIKHKLMNCHKHGETEHTLIGIKFTRWKCKRCTNEYSRKFVRGLKIKCVEYKGGKCIKCGYNKCLEALEFHHRDPTQKDFGFAQYQKASYKRLAEELDKCDLLCANCHREEHVRLKLDCNSEVG